MNKIVRLVKKYKIFLLALLLAVFCKLFVFDIYIVKGESMYPSLSSKNIIICEKLTYWFIKPSINDIIILDYTGDTLVKRVEAVEGDSIKMENHILYRNNLKLLDGIETKSSKYLVKSSKYLVIPKGYVFVLGDNKNHSIDSRYFGPISTKEVKGKLLFSIKI